MQIRPTPEVDSTVRRILGLLFQFRRLSSATDPCAKQPCATCYATHWEKMRRFVAAGEPVHFVIPAFPAKSRNPDKVLGPLPDLGERLATSFLESFCDQIAHFHEPGARVTICSDGHVFSDILEIPDEDVTAYRGELQRIIRSSGGGSVDIYSLENAYPASSFEHMRELLVAKHAQPIEQISESVRQDQQWRSLFNGIHRFMVEDQSTLCPGLSRTKIRARCKSLAYQVIQRSNAWGSLIAETFPFSMRLSIHPQPSHGEKVGFHMIRTMDNWLTPWHGVVVDNGTTFTLVKRKHAEHMQASLVWRNSRPSHFVYPRSELEKVA